jgi:hypothetical protein
MTGFNRLNSLAPGKALDRQRRFGGLSIIGEAADRDMPIEHAWRF